MSATNKDLIGTLTPQAYVADALRPSTLRATATCAGLGGSPDRRGLTAQVVYYPVQSAGNKNPRIDIPPEPGV